MRAVVFCAMVVCATCSGEWKPLATPIAPEHRIAAGVRVAISLDDTAHLEETIGVLVGQQLDLATAPTQVAATDYHMGAVAAQLPLAAVSVVWGEGGTATASADLAKSVIAVAIGRTGEPACALGWQIWSGSAQVVAAARAGQAGSVDIVLTQPPTTTVTFGPVIDADQCLALLPAGSKEFVDAQLRLAVQAAWAPRLSGATLKVLRTLVPTSLVAAGTTGTALAGDPASAVRASLGYGEVAGASLIKLNSKFAAAPLQVGIDADRHPCAVDQPAPSIIVAAQLPPTVSPQAKAVLRRALVVDLAVLQHAGWALARSGGWCRQSASPLGEAVPSGWAGATVTSLAKWADDAPPTVRMWPHAAPELELGDTATGPVVRWQFADATLEFIGVVGGVPAMVLAVRGKIRGTMRPTLAANNELLWVAESGSVDSAIVTSPLAGGTVAANAEPLGTLVDAAVRGIFTPAPVLPLAALLPAGTVATSMTRAGDALWLWLDGGVTVP